MLAERRDTVRAVLESVDDAGRFQGRDSSDGRIDLEPAVARRKLWVRPDFLHRVDARVGDLRSVESRYHLRRRERAKGVENDRLERGTVLVPTSIGGKTGLGGE